MSRVLLLDADVIAYNAASACEVAIPYGDGYWAWHVSSIAGQKVIYWWSAKLKNMGTGWIRLADCDSFSCFLYVEENRMHTFGVTWCRTTLIAI